MSQAADQSAKKAQVLERQLKEKTEEVEKLADLNVFLEGRLDHAGKQNGKLLALHAMFARMIVLQQSGIHALSFYSAHLLKELKRERDRADELRSLIGQWKEAKVELKQARECFRKTVQRIFFTVLIGILIGALIGWLAKRLVSGAILGTLVAGKFSYSKPLNDLKQPIHACEAKIDSLKKRFGAILLERSSLERC